ncbi:MBOAT family protein [Kineothrix sp. MSJ-39]|uniref:MBOAT family O-acyltransferase n=1 Tax=Kineothrix sp. MSJ-39 TaxID=2841533 RepID=UPI001C112F5C|nr:MBOAT family O-acyltransferase [Kineothrix sp. MSJ-39]MBU5429179.1 MBOAT family protein [Kineothrix sp. MSJ-39]
MLFNSISFLCFFPIVVLIYFLIPKKARYLWLLFASYYFYMSQNPGFALLLLFTTVITYASGLMLSALSRKRKPEADCLKKWVVFGSVFANLGILFLCKYIPFHLLVPVGISFYTFQALSYTIDVYREKTASEKNFFRYALYVSFFPTILSGPIQRAADFLPQLQTLAQKKLWDEKRIANGLFFMLWGYFLKLVLADRIAVFVNAAYADYENLGSGILVLAAVLYAFQIYCDFAGYSCIAIGAGTVMGFELMRNFDAPYLAVSIKDFWRRWHISLSSYLRDYLYIPLGGNRKGQIRKYLNLLLTFLASGMWHGAGLHFVFWGGLHGVYQILGDLLRKSLPQKMTQSSHFALKLLRVVRTFLLTSFAWIFFRADSLQMAFAYIRRMIAAGGISQLFDGTLLGMGLDLYEWGILLAGLFVLILADILKNRGQELTERVMGKPLILRYIVALCLLAAVYVYGMYGPAYDAAQFIYFQF